MVWWNCVGARPDRPHAGKELLAERCVRLLSSARVYYIFNVIVLDHNKNANGLVGFPGQ